MKKILFLSISIFAYSKSQAQDFKILSSSNEELLIEVNFKWKNVPQVQVGNQSYFDFSALKVPLTQESGSPALPQYHTSIQLPNTGNPTIEVVSDEFENVMNSNVLPSKGSLKRNVEPSSVPYTFGNVYQSNNFYPVNIAQLESPFVWRAVRGSVLTVTPYQVNPSTNTLQFHKKMVFKIRFNKNSAGYNELTSVFNDKVMKRSQTNVFINPTAEKYTIMEEEGHMLVIADPNLADEVQSLVNWKNQKGIKTTLVTTAITGTTDENIKNYIETAYQADSYLLYVLLVGDHEQIPAHTYGNSGGEELYSDSYYAQMSLDFYPELFVGRFSGNASQVTTMVNRTLEYEKNPAAGSWMENAIGLGSDEGDGIGDDDEPDWEHLRNIRTVLMNYGYSTVHEFYDGSHNGADAAGSPNSGIILPAVNSGIGLFNYTGHGDVNLCVTGNFQSTHINQATNAGFYPFVISVACNNGTFTGGSCISEAWLRATNNSLTTGAIAAAGSSILMNWAEPMQTQDEMAEIIAGNYPDNKKATLGGLFYNSQSSMLENYPGSGGKEVMQTWVLFGDPSTLFRNKQTMPLTATHQQTVNEGTTSLTVNCAVEGATIAISQNDILLGKAVVNGGSATISFPAIASLDQLLVTATKQNYGVYQGNVNVSGLGLSVNEDLFSVYPVPASNKFTVQTNSSALTTIELIDMNGVVLRSIPASMSGITEFEVGELANGNYIVKFSGTGVASRKLIQILQ